MTGIKQLCLASSVAAVAWGSACQAAETIEYTYDARGQLVMVTTKVASEPEPRSVVTYSYDKAGNRINYKSSKKNYPKVVVVPLGGFMVIPLPD
jgi:hypothetical protein